MATKARTTPVQILGRLGGGAVVLALPPLSQFSPRPAAAQGFAEPLQAEPSLAFGVEVKVHYRDTEDARFAVNFPFVAENLPRDQNQGFLEAVEPGSHFDVGAVTLWYKGTWDEAWGGGLATKVKIDLIDLHDRNPTSTADEWDIDEAWLRWGPETEPGEMHEGMTAYAKLGKFPKFERQDDRHLESYGLVSTAFNRMEDIGLEIGSDLGSVFYTKATFTEGNPLFLRDPNALAGDNGIPVLLTAFPDPELKSGIAIPYDADTSLEDVSIDDHEIGFGLGVRLGEETGAWNHDILAFADRRDLADTRTFYGSIYLFSYTNLGKRLGFLVTGAAVFGWLTITSMLFVIYAPRGPKPENIEGLNAFEIRIIPMTYMIVSAVLFLVFEVLLLDLLPDLARNVRADEPVNQIGGEKDRQDKTQDLFAEDHHAAQQYNGDQGDVEVSASPQVE